MRPARYVMIIERAAERAQADVVVLARRAHGRFSFVVDDHRLDVDVTQTCPTDSVVRGRPAAESR